MDCLPLGVAVSQRQIPEFVPGPGVMVVVQVHSWAQAYTSLAHSMCVPPGVWLSDNWNGLRDCGKNTLALPHLTQQPMALTHIPAVSHRESDQVGRERITFLMPLGLLLL